MAPNHQLYDDSHMNKNLQRFLNSQPLNRNDLRNLQNNNNVRNTSNFMNLRRLRIGAVRGASTRFSCKQIWCYLNTRSSDKSHIHNIDESLSLLVKLVFLLLIFTWFKKTYFEPPAKTTKKPVKDYQKTCNCQKIIKNQFLSKIVQTFS